jgi:hypothetical protein
MLASIILFSFVVVMVHAKTLFLELGVKAKTTRVKLNLPLAHEPILLF